MAKSYRKFLAGAATTAVVASSFAGVAGAASFNDVTDRHKEAVDFLVSKGINGLSNTKFGTQENIKRVDAAVFVAKTLGLDTKNAPDAGFTDVPERAKGAVNALKKAGITSGKTATTFGAEDLITRGELAIWIQKGFELKPSRLSVPFTDVSERYADAVATLLSNEITSGISATKFGTFDNAKRGDFAVFLFKAYNVKKDKDDDKDGNVVEIPKDIITISSKTGNALTNGDSKTYTVKVVSPVSGKAVPNATVNVTFKENLGTNGKPQNNIVVTNGHQSVVPYQANDNTEAQAQITTDKDGEATFTVTGANGTVTPIAFLDGSNQEWDLKDAEKPPRVKDGRFDKETEYYVQAPSVTFSATQYKISVEGKRTKFAATGEKNGREYNVTVTNADGTPYRGIINVGLDELEDNDPSNNLTDAYFVKTDADFIYQNKTSKPTHVDIRTDLNGKATIKLVSNTPNDMATPVVWIDNTYSNNAQEHKLEVGESRSKDVEYTNFQAEYVAKGEAGAKLEVSKIANRGKGFNLTLLNQSGKAFLPSSAGLFTTSLDARVTFTVKNDGPSHVTVDTAVLDNVAAVAGKDYSGDKTTGKFIIQSGGTLTFAGDIPNNWFTSNKDYMVYVNAPNGDARVSVTASAVVSNNVDKESQSVAVGPVSANELIQGTGSGTVAPQGLTTKDSDDEGTDHDQVVLTFTEDVFTNNTSVGFDKNDFALHLTNGNTIVPTAVKYEVKTNDINKKVENQLVLQFSDADIKFAKADAASTISYDGARGNADVVLIDYYGSLVKAFNKAVN